MANKRPKAAEHMYRINFVLMRSVNVLNRPSIGMACYDKSHDPCMHPMCHDLHGLLNIAVEWLELVPLLQ